MTCPDRRSVLKAIGGTVALATTGAGTVGARAGARGDETIVDVAANADDFDVLVAAVSEAGLVDVLAGNRQLTVFAPTDRAFEAAGITVDTVDEVPDDALVSILTYHITPGRRYADSVGNAPRLPTLNGEPIEVEGTVLNDGQAEIVSADVEASNGVVHVVDGVLRP